MRHLIAFFVFSGFLAGSGQFAHAQRGTIQLPVVGRFGVSTTVSVPDRGRAHLGSLSRAGESRKSFGPLGLGSSRGMFRDHSSTSVGVTIHDFEEADRRLLGRSSRYPTGPRLSSGAENAYRSLLARHAAQTNTGVSGQPMASVGSTRRSTATRARTRVRGDSARSLPRRTTNRSGYAEKFFDDGLRAESRGAYSLARHYYRVAARLGSKTAQQRYEVLARKQSAAVLRR